MPIDNIYVYASAQLKTKFTLKTGKLCNEHRKILLTNHDSNTNHHLQQHKSLITQFHFKLELIRDIVKNRK